MQHEDWIKKIHWLGHDCLRLDGSVTVYFDPFRISPGVGADLILITHDHYDHCSPEDVEKIRKKETTIVTDAASARKLEATFGSSRPGIDYRSRGSRLKSILPTTPTRRSIPGRRECWPLW